MTSRPARSPPGTPLFQVVTNPVTGSNPSGSQNPGLTTGNLGVPESANRGIAGDDSLPRPQPQAQPSVPAWHVPDRTGALAGSNRLEVTTVEGLAVGDLILINGGQPNQEVVQILGFGSIITTPLRFNHALGEPITRLGPAPTQTHYADVHADPVADRLAHGSATATSTHTQTPTPYRRPPTVGAGGATIQVNSGADSNVRDAVLTLREALLIATGGLGIGSLSARRAGPGDRRRPAARRSPTRSCSPPAAATITLTSALPPLSTGNDIVDGGGSTTIQGIAGIDCLAIASNGNTIRGLTHSGAVANGVHVTERHRQHHRRRPAAVTQGTSSARTPASGIVLASGNNTVEGNFVGTNAAGTAPDANGTGVVGARGGQHHRRDGRHHARWPLPRKLQPDLRQQHSRASTSSARRPAGTWSRATSSAPTPPAPPRVANGDTASDLSRRANNIVGGTAAAARNVISGNASDGVGVDRRGADRATSSRATTSAPTPPAPAACRTGRRRHRRPARTATRSAARRHHARWPLHRTATWRPATPPPVSPCSAPATTGNTVVQGNYIGTNAAGSTEPPNGNGAASWSSTRRPTRSAGRRPRPAGNVISGNSGGRHPSSPAWRRRAPRPGQLHRHRRGRRRGRGRTRSAASSSHHRQPAGNTIGGDRRPCRRGNVISGNGSTASHSPAEPPTAISVARQLHRHRRDGTADLRQRRQRRAHQRRQRNITIGGDDAGGAQRHLRQRPASAISVSRRGTTGNIVQGNYIGTDAAGTARREQRSAASRSTTSPPGNTVGGDGCPCAQPATVISGNGWPTAIASSRSGHVGAPPIESGGT